ncbi:hypothetical protein B5D77_13740 [Microcystis sp. MC19]|nr:hypothetical protein B5D77_13740 [Microcystis sp. MC19]
MLRKTSQFSGKAKPNTQHLNPSESFCWVSLGVLLGFLASIVGFPWVYCWVSLRQPNLRNCSDCLDCQGVTQKTIKELLSNLKSQARKKRSKN